MVAEMGFNTMLTEGAKHILGWKSPNFLYCNSINPKLKILLKNYQLSDDIAFRFSQTSWSEWPLTTEKYVDWLNAIDYEQECVNLFMDYETFGEHQWPETGIFYFLRALPGRVFSHSNYKFYTPSELSKLLQPVSPVYVPYPISWADEERDLTAWLGNELQNDAFDRLYEIEEKVKYCNDPAILKDWRYLQTSDHFYYMCTKWFSDGDVHKYFNPYNTPYEAFINFMNILSDFLIRINEICPEGNIIVEQKTEQQPAETKKPFVKKEEKKTAVKKVATEEKSTDKQPETIKKKKGVKKIIRKKIIVKAKPVKEIVKKAKKKSVATAIPASKKNVSKIKVVKVRGNELNLFSHISKAAIKELFRNSDINILAYALTGAKKEIEEKVKSALGYIFARKLKTVCSKIVNPQATDIKAARKEIEEKIKKYLAKQK